MNIRTKLQITFFGVALLLAVSLMSIVYLSMVTHFEQQEGNRLKDNVIQSANAIDNFMFSRVKDFNVLSNNPLFSISSNETISEYLLRVVEQYPFYEYIAFTDKEANILSSSSQGVSGLNIIDLEPDIKEEFYKTLNGGDDDLHISDIAKVSQKEIEENSPLDIELLSNVIDLDGNIIGVLVGFINIQFIRDIVYDIDKRTIGDEYAYLVNDPGDIVISANPEIKTLQPHPDLLINNLKQKLEGDEDGFLIYENSKGIKVISGYADLSEYGTDKVGDWSLLSTAPYDEIMNPIYQMLYKAFFAFSFILTVIFILIFVFSRTLSKPIIQLQKVVSEFNMDSKPIKLKIGKNDEVGSLSESFNTMTENLYKSSEERKYTEKTLRESEANLKEANASKDKFFSIISHDLRGPFNTILGFSEILNENFDNYDTTKQKQYLGYIHSGIKKTYKLLDDLLLWARSQKDNIDFNPQAINLFLLANETCELFEQSKKNKLIELTNQIPEDIYIVADKDMISTVFRNLISNALKFTSKGGEIIIKAENLEQFAKISIKDNGLGMSKEIQSKLFDITENISTAGTENEKGTGLGLILCKEFVIKHGGKIWVKSETNRGSTFFLTIPNDIQTGANNGS